MASNNSHVTAPMKSESTLVEFPGKTHASKPQWRKELSQKFREIQEKRAQVPASEQNNEPSETLPAQLQLVPRTSGPDVNPIVVAALKRIERARQKAEPAPRLAAVSNAGMASNFAVLTTTVAPEVITSRPVETELPFGLSDITEETVVKEEEENTGLQLFASEYELPKTVVDMVEAEVVAPPVPVFVDLPVGFIETVVTNDP
ncbi:MAG: hypothetical protein ACRD4L_11510, partial [Pyrinomonadaceae bacterium]